MTESITRTEQRLLGMIFRRGPLIQNVLADDMELTQQTVSRLTSGLIERGMLKLGEKVSAGRRPSTALVIDPGHIRSAGVAIMADAVAVAVTDFAGRPLGEATIRLPAMRTDAVLDAVRASLQTLLDPLNVPLRDLAGIGVSVAGSFAGSEPGFNTPRALDGWANIDVAPLFAERFGHPVLVDNDGNAAALAESIIGAGRWATSFGYLYLGSGVGGGIVLDRRPWRGRVGNAGEFAGGLPPNIYPFPNLELLRQMLGREGPVFGSVLDMVEAYDPSWPAIDDWIARVRDSLSIIASNLTAILDLDAIVLGGLMPRDLAERAIPRIELFDQRRRAHLRPTAQLVPSEIDGNAAAIGAAILPLQAAYYR